MPIFDMKHMFFSMAGSAVGAIAGYMFGVFLYVMLLCSSVFTTSTNLITLATSAGVWPILFAFFGMFLGFAAGWYISHEKDSTPKPQSAVLDIGPSLAYAINDMKTLIQAEQGLRKQEDGPPAAHA
jgi:hypothetical protein